LEVQLPQPHAMAQHRPSNGRTVASNLVAS
jgi:hypothetical protein